MGWSVNLEGFLVVSQHRGTPIYTPKRLYNPYYTDPKRVPVISGNPLLRLSKELQKNCAQPAFEGLGSRL